MHQRHVAAHIQVSEYVIHTNTHRTAHSIQHALTQHTPKTQTHSTRMQAHKVIVLDGLESGFLPGLFTIRSQF